MTAIAGPLSEPPEKFLEGHSPLWEDLASKRDVPLNVVTKIVDRARSFFDGTDSGKRIQVLIVEGTAGCGKTTAMMRAAAEIADLGVDTLFFMGHDRLRDDVLTKVVECISPAGRLAIVVDDLADHIHQAIRFIEHYPVNAGRCFLLSAVPGRRQAFH